MTIELSKLTYNLTDLEPYISQKSLEYHYGELHKGCVDNLNQMIEGTNFQNKSLEYIIQNAKDDILKNAILIWNHEFYWCCMAPVASDEPTGDLLNAINKSFGSFAEFKTKFSKIATETFGSGCIWLIKNIDGSLEIVNMTNASTPIADKKFPLLACDIWEHAYPIDYRNDLSEYIKNFWHLVNWEFVASKYKEGVLSKVEKALRIINYTKVNTHGYTGKKFEAGYHTVILEGKIYEGARDNFQRIKAVKGFDFNGKVILDIGCYTGGMLHAISDKIKSGVGVDLSRKAINGANIIKSFNKITNLDFYVFNLDRENFQLINQFVLEDKIDMCMFLAVAMHIKKWKEVIEFCHANSSVLLFESNGKSTQQKNQVAFIRELYDKVTYLFSDGDRKMYLCT